MQNNFQVTLNLPDDFLGRELELLIFKKEDVEDDKVKASKVKLSDKFKGAFTKEDAASFNAHTKNSRSEWKNI